MISKQSLSNNSLLLPMVRGGESEPPFKIWRELLEFSRAGSWPGICSPAPSYTLWHHRYVEVEHCSIYSSLPPALLCLSLSPSLSLSICLPPPRSVFITPSQSLIEQLSLLIHLEIRKVEAGERRGEGLCRRERGERRDKQWKKGHREEEGMEWIDML